MDKYLFYYNGREDIFEFPKDTDESVVDDEFCTWLFESHYVDIDDVDEIWDDGICYYRKIKEDLRDIVEDMKLETPYHLEVSNVNSEYFGQDFLFTHRVKAAKKVWLKAESQRNNQELWFKIDELEEY